MSLYRWMRGMLATLCIAAAAAGAVAQVPPGRAAITFFEHEDFQGAAFGLDAPAPDFRALQFNDTVSSVIVRRGQWEVCQDIRYRGRCIVLGPGRYPSLRPYDLNDAISSARPGADVGQAVGADLVLFEHDDFRGRRVASSGDVPDFGPLDFSYRISSIVIGAGTWQLCNEAGYRGQCIVLGPGRHASLRAYGFNDAIASARRTHLPPGGTPLLAPPPGTLPPPGGAPPPPSPGAAVDGRSACTDAAIAQVRNEHPRAPRVHVLPDAVWAVDEGPARGVWRGRGEYETREGSKRFRFECAATPLGARITVLRYSE